MRLLLNGEELEGVMPAQATLAGALQAVQDQEIPADHVIAGIWIDDDPLTAELLSQWKDRPAEEFSEARIEAASRNALAANGLRILGEGLHESKADREKIVDCLCQGRSSEAMGLLNDYLQIWLGVQQTIAGACRLVQIPLEQLEIDRPADCPPADELINHLAEELQQLKSALEAGDFVLVGDILDYEFGGITENFQIILDRLADQIEPQPLG